MHAKFSIGSVNRKIIPGNLCAVCRLTADLYAGIVFVSDQYGQDFCSPFIRQVSRDSSDRRR